MNQNQPRLSQQPPSDTLIKIAAMTGKSLDPQKNVTPLQAIALGLLVPQAPCRYKQPYISGWSL